MRGANVIDWDALSAREVTMPAGSTFWRGTGHGPDSLGEGETLRAFSWLSTSRQECSVYARKAKGDCSDGPWMSRYEASRDLRVLSLVVEEGVSEFPKGIEHGSPVFLAELAARGYDLLLYGEKSFFSTPLGYWDHVRPLTTGILALVDSCVTSPEIESGHYEDALLKATRDRACDAGHGGPTAP